MPVDEKFYEAARREADSVAIQLGQESHWWIRVFPVRLADLVEAVESIVEAIKAVGGLTNENLADASKNILPTLALKCSALVGGCCMAWRDTGNVESQPQGPIDISLLPLPVQAEIATAWIKLSFPPEKTRPLLDALQAAFGLEAGNLFGSPSNSASNGSSPTDMTDSTSSTGRVPPGLIPVGP